MIRPLSSFAGVTYQHAIKPIFFQISPDLIHENFLKLGRGMGAVAPVRSAFHTAFAYQHPSLEQTVAGIDFANPIGLAAGYDYEGWITQITPSLGFGWHTIGSVTNGAYAGNTPPRYGRLPNSGSLWVNKGFKSPGAEVMRERIAQLQPSLPIGVSIGATNQHYDDLKQVLQEYDQAFGVLRDLPNISYFELNISCPNLVSKFSLYDPKNLRPLLKVMDQAQLPRPIFVKMPVDISLQRLHDLLDAIQESSATGIIIGNLTKNRANPQFWRTELAQLPEHGGLSGKPLSHVSNALIREAYRHSGKDLIIVGCGGVFSAEDAYEKILSGASLVQMITGMIFQGPQVIGQINQGLAQRLHQDGFTHIQQAIGIGVE